MTIAETLPRARKPRAKRPPLATKLRPRQARGQDTFELILETAGQLLERVGFEQLTTNLICQAAGLSPPALYRYFPNKYAVLKELGDRLMRAQDDEVMAWVDAGGLLGDTVEERLAKSLAIHERMATIQREFPGGSAIGRALRAVPVLQDLRFRSRDMVAAHFLKHMREMYPATDPRRLEVVTRMTVELSYAATEMVVEEPDRDADIINREVCLLFAHYFASFS
ncbi:MAG: helix-turn-helix domain containing protein [Candidatus Sphingomonas colombiensis]|nr:TetR/AcrR family transcriptional regulator [Sphingomonas sp.]WEK44071.1 MAG: helix-turn-helix domain containing protein [Sphingomonas sp.]